MEPIWGSLTLPINVIVRPNDIRQTPRRLKTALQARRTIPVSDVVQVDYSRDLLIGLPPPAKVINAPPDYDSLFSFYSANKRTQRSRMVSDGLPVVPTVCAASAQSLPSGKYVVRPLNHRQGAGFRITESQRDFNPATEYISAFIPKTKEFRTIYYKGRRVCTYLKKTPEEQFSPEQPWTFSNGCRFITIQNPQENDRLLSSGLYASLDNHWIVKAAHLVAVDVLWDGRRGERKPYICEFNFAPGLTIASTFNRICEIENDG